MSEEQKNRSITELLRVQSANKEAVALQKIEGNPFDDDDLFFIEKAIAENWDQAELQRQIRLHAKLDNS